MLGEEGNGVGEERAVPEPPLRGDRRMGMDSSRRFHGGGLCAGIAEGGVECWVRKGMAWERNGRFPNRPYGETGGWGWIPVAVFTGAGSARE